MNSYPNVPKTNKGPAMSSHYEEGSKTPPMDLYDSQSLFVTMLVPSY